MFDTSITVLAVMRDHQPSSVEVALGVIGSVFGILAVSGLAYLAPFIGEPLIGLEEASDDGTHRTSSSPLSGIIPRLPWYAYICAGSPFFLLYPAWGGGFLSGVLGGGGFLVNASLLRAVKRKVISYPSTAAIIVAMAFAYNEGAGWF